MQNYEEQSNTSDRQIRLFQVDSVGQIEFVEEPLRELDEQPGGNSTAVLDAEPAAA